MMTLVVISLGLSLFSLALNAYNRRLERRFENRNPYAGKLTDAEYAQLRESRQWR